MIFRDDYYKETHKYAGSIFIKTALFFAFLSFTFCYDGLKNNAHSKKPFEIISVANRTRSAVGDAPWDGPILFHKGNGKPVHLILVEKSLQKLHLYCYDGRYHLVKSYDCSTGEAYGKKQEENDKKTPEGIYFNVKSYRDSKITLFGDRAFGLSYPDIFDSLEGKCGNGIFIHGSDQPIKPFSTNGCVVLNTRDLADLDQRIQLEKTPVIIAERLSYRFKPSKKELDELMVLLRQAMLPERYRALNPQFRYITVIGFEKRVVAVSEVRINDGRNKIGFSRLYIYRSGEDILELLKREWSEE